MYIISMFTFLQTGLNSFINLIFPERKQEKIVSHLSENDIALLPKAVLSSPETYALFSYKDARVQALIWELKYHRNAIALEIVGRLLAEHIIEELSDTALFARTTDTLVVAVPLTQQHLRERKFSQTDLLCREIIKYIPQEISYIPLALKKIRETEKQSKTRSRAERLKNIHGSFLGDEKIVYGKNIILIDDVTTTGATIAEATRALKLAGAKKVMTFTVAH
jgi:ComF family protein